MLDIPLDVETKAFVLSFAGAFAGLFVARAVCLAGHWLSEVRRPPRHFASYTTHTFRTLP